eukprot:466448-Alexandrium_andersonii.AAC.1
MHDNRSARRPFRPQCCTPPLHAHCTHRECRPQPRLLARQPVPMRPGGLGTPFRLAVEALTWPGFCPGSWTSSLGASPSPSPAEQPPQQPARPHPLVA